MLHIGKLTATKTFVHQAIYTHMTPAAAQLSTEESFRYTAAIPSTTSFVAIVHGEHGSACGTATRIATCKGQGDFPQRKKSDRHRPVSTGYRLVFSTTSLPVLQIPNGHPWHHPLHLVSTCFDGPELTGHIQFSKQSL